MALVYRFHAKDPKVAKHKCGPYGNITAGSWSVFHTKETGHPSLYNDGGSALFFQNMECTDYTFDDCYCGFSTLLSAYTWFTRADVEIMEKMVLN